MVVHVVPCPSTGETKSSVTVDTARRNAARLAPPLCSERISPLLCRCFFFLFEGRGRGRSGRRLLACTSSVGVQSLSEGTAAHLPWLGSHCLHPFSPLFDATTIAHNARPPGDGLEAVISHFTFEAKKVEIWRGRREGGASPVVVVGTGYGAGSGRPAKEKEWDLGAMEGGDLEVLKFSLAWCTPPCPHHPPRRVLPRRREATWRCWPGS